MGTIVDVICEKNVYLYNNIDSGFNDLTTTKTSNTINKNINSINDLAYELNKICNNINNNNNTIVIEEKRLKFDVNLDKIFNIDFNQLIDDDSINKIFNKKIYFIDVVLDTIDCHFMNHNTWIIQREFRDIKTNKLLHVIIKFKVKVVQEKNLWKWHEIYYTINDVNNERNKKIFKGVLETINKTYDKTINSKIKYDDVISTIYMSTTRYQNGCIFVDIVRLTNNSYYCIGGIDITKIDKSINLNELAKITKKFSKTEKDVISPSKLTMRALSLNNEKLKSIKHLQFENYQDFEYKYVNEAQKSLYNKYIIVCNQIISTKAIINTNKKKKTSKTYSIKFYNKNKKNWNDEIELLNFTKFIQNLNMLISNSICAESTINIIMNNFNKSINKEISKNELQDIFNNKLFKKNILKINKKEDIYYCYDIDNVKDEIPVFKVVSN